MGRRIATVAASLLGLFGVLAVVQAYWQVIAAPALVGASFDRRPQLRHNLVKPGALRAGDGEAILAPVRSGGRWVYRYEHPRAFCHITGYSARTGLRGRLHEALYGEGRFMDWWGRLRAPFPQGCDVVLTIDASLQEAAVEAVGEQPGCLMAVRVSDGAVMAAVSSPSFDPVAIAADTALLEITRTDPDEPLVFRPAQRLYRPGWAMAWVTAAAAIEAGCWAEGQRLECGGAWRCGRKVYRCTADHGRLSLPQALRRQCVVGIQRLAHVVGRDAFRDFIKRLHLLDRPALGIAGLAGKLPDLYNWRARENLAETAVGTGAVRLTPVAVARFFLAVARSGDVVQPYVIERVVSSSGKVMLKGRPDSLGAAWSAEAARRLGELVSAASGTVDEEAASAPACAVVSWWVASQERPERGEAWAVVLAPWPGAKVVVLAVVEKARDERAAVEKAVYLINYLQRLGGLS